MTHANTGGGDEEDAEELFVRRFESIPADTLYGDWITNDIHPYQFDVNAFTDTVTLQLIDSFECEFHMPFSGPTTSGFGPRWGRYHYGQDIDLNTGDSVHSVFDGVVRIAQYSRSYGYCVVVRHYNGLETLYAHLSRLIAKPGDEVDAGDILGLGGSTGRSTGSHLHFEVRYKGWAIDPSSVIDFSEGKLVSNEFEVSKGNFKYVSTPVKTASKSTATASSGRYVTVKSGDTLSAIAHRNGTTVSRICQLSGISASSIIRPGQRVRVK